MGKRGPQPGTGGRPKKPLADKLLDSNPSKEKLKFVSLPKSENLYDEDMPTPKKYYCEHLVTQQNLEQYSMVAARWIQCEEVISEYGSLAKHPTTGAAIASPYESMAREYFKYANALWNQIYAVVRDNCSTNYNGLNPQDDVMERLLTARSNRNGS